MIDLYDRSLESNIDKVSIQVKNYVAPIKTILWLQKPNREQYSAQLFGSADVTLLSQIIRLHQFNAKATRWNICTGFRCSHE